MWNARRLIDGEIVYLDPEGRLQEKARVGSIVYLCFGVVNSAISMARQADLMRQMRTAMPGMFPSGSATVGLMWIFPLMGAAFGAVPIYFLIRRAPAFERYCSAG